MLNLFKRLKNKFNKYKTVIDDVDSIKQNFKTIENIFSDVYTNLDDISYDIKNIKSKLKEMEE